MCVMCMWKYDASVMIVVFFINSCANLSSKINLENAYSKFPFDLPARQLD